MTNYLGRLLRRRRGTKPCGEPENASSVETEVQQVDPLGLPLAPPNHLCFYCAISKQAVAKYVLLDRPACITCAEKRHPTASYASA
jgi:hypothetical protein